ncbi:nuclease-related domain-containing protein [Denitrificimonas caeni]|uniref:nuclease-related domain-containing protein n=1 Tax=Denitrificimonas caeni TaxID=521720 RepID=UPI001965AC22|nr:NERD domain-containing protein [Denitrificimonas caeni]
MSYSPAAYAVLQALYGLIPIVLIIGFLKTRWFKGVLGETMVKFAAKIRLPAGTYHPIHNITLPTQEGSTQIDHIFVSRFGIFVVETKNIKGWVFGAQNQAQWTQQLFNTSFKFQNPLRQNYKHIMVLRATLDVPSRVIYSVVAFVGRSTFKSAMPANVTRGWGYITYIKSFREEVLSEAEVQRVLATIQSARLEPTRATNRRHIKQLKKRLHPSAQKKCPKCDRSMVLRTAQRGSNIGRSFWGCSAYPACRAVQSMT